MQVEEEEKITPDLFLSSLRRSSFLETETAKQNMHQHITQITILYRKTNKQINKQKT